MMRHQAWWPKWNHCQISAAFCSSQNSISSSYLPTFPYKISILSLSLSSSKHLCSSQLFLNGFHFLVPSFTSDSFALTSVWPFFVCLCSKIFTLQHSIFCDIFQAQYFHLNQIATSFCLKFFLSSLPRISLPHLLSLSTSLSDFHNFQHFFCKYFCYVAKLFFNTCFAKFFFNISFAKLFLTLLLLSFFQHFFHTIFFSTPFA